MKTKFHFTSLFITFGFLLISNITFACEKKAEKSCCKKEVTSEAQKSCCSNDESDNKGGCEGKCGHSNCTTNTIIVSFLQNNEVDFTTNKFVFFSKKQRFFNIETYISSGFYSIWSPPNIG